MTVNHRSFRRISFGLAILAFASGLFARSYHVDAVHGDDARDGVTPATAWRTLARASRASLQPGDEVLLRRGQRFPGSLKITVAGEVGKPVRVADYASEGAAEPPVIDAAGWLAGLALHDCRHVVVENLAIVADGGESRESEARRQRYGVYVTATGKGDFGHIRLRGLRISDIFASEQVPDEGRNPTSNWGMGVSVMLSGDEARLADVVVERCTIARTGRTGIRLHGPRNAAGRFLEHVSILDNRLSDIGGPGIIPSRCRQVVVRGNSVERSGSFLDPRMHGRGSGIWPWGCEDVLIERNRFLHARGRGDSCGIHIDLNCRDVVVQYNLSADNEGGFVEILGNNHNCVYRYNVSVNDGARIKGRDGAHQDGKILWTTGDVGGASRIGPFNSYIYNNTIFVAPGRRSSFAIGATTEGLLIANNIFHVAGETLLVAGDHLVRDAMSHQAVPRAVMANNLYLSTKVLPEGFPMRDAHPMIGDPSFRRPGGLAPADYEPLRPELVRDRGLAIEALPGDPIGLRRGLAVTTDILGRPIRGRPDLGAIEID